MSRFTPYYKHKSPGKPGKSVSISAETSYGSPEHAKWLFEQNMTLHSPEMQIRIRKVKKFEDFSELCAEVLEAGVRNYRNRGI